VPFFSENSSCGRRLLKQQREKDRVSLVLNLVDGDETVVALIEQLLESAVNYVDAVFRMETTLATQRLLKEGSDIGELTEELDSKRHRKHDLLIDSIRIVNRNLFRNFKDDIPPGGVYSDDPAHIDEKNTNRAAVGDWAGRLVLSYFEDRRR